MQQVGVGPTPSERRTARVRIRLTRIALYTMIVVVLIVFLFPFYWMLQTSLQTARSLFAGIHLVPRSLTIDNYLAVLESPFINSIRNSLVVAIGTTLLTTSLALAAAYSFVRYRYRGKRFLSRIIVLVYLFPTVVVLVPMYFFVGQIGLHNRPLALIPIHTVLTLPFCVWLLQSFLDNVPRSPEEAAMVFGASRLTAFRLITLPLAVPGILAAAAFAFIVSWGEYMFAFVLMSDPRSKTVPGALRDLLSDYAIDWGFLTAAGVVATAPVLLLFWIMAKYLTAGIARGIFER